MNKAEFTQAVKLAVSNAYLVGVPIPEGYPNRCTIEVNDEYTKQYLAAMWELLDPFTKLDEGPIHVTLVHVAQWVRYQCLQFNGELDQNELKICQDLARRKITLIAPDTSMITKDQALAIVGELTARYDLPVEVNSQDWLQPGTDELKYAH